MECPPLPVTGDSAGGSNDWVAAAAYGARTWVILMHDTSESHQMYTSSDGITWVERVSPLPAAYPVLAWNGVDLFMINDGGGNVATSPDGITWTAYSVPHNSHSLPYGAGVCLARGLSCALKTSGDEGSTWNTRISTTGGTIYALIYANNQFVSRKALIFPPDITPPSGRAANYYPPPKINTRRKYVRKTKSRY